MPINVVVGAQWGDEGKGRVVDLLSTEADYVARYSGGDNAGHTVTVGKQTFKLHLVPSGIIQPHTISVIGNGVVINPITLLSEIESLHEAGVNINPHRLRISHAAHLITPGHIALDKAQELARGESKIGTTLRGIGPAYTDKVARRGLRFGQMLNMKEFKQALQTHFKNVNERLTRMYGAEALDIPEIIDEFMAVCEKLTKYICDISILLTDALSREKNILAEGAQGTLLDLDHGTYPFVTSSNPVAPAVLTGLGLGIGNIDRVIGVTKAFQTRVGSGPFPTEAVGDIANRLRGSGENPWDEFGTTTGRPRRVGWLDLVLLRYAVRINGLNELTLTKLDVLSGLDNLKICVAYKQNDDIHHELPYGPTNLSDYNPVYVKIPGWEEDITNIRKWENLPKQARTYIKQVEELSKTPVKYASVGPERHQIVKIN